MLAVSWLELSAGLAGRHGPGSTYDTPVGCRGLRVFSCPGPGWFCALWTGGWGQPGFSTSAEDLRSSGKARSRFSQLIHICGRIGFADLPGMLPC